MVQGTRQSGYRKTSDLKSDLKEVILVSNFEIEKS